VIPAQVVHKEPSSSMGTEAQTRSVALRFESPHDAAPPLVGPSS